MYACAEIVYGFDFTDDSSLTPHLEALLQDSVNNEKGDGYKTPYSGWAQHHPRAFGLGLGGIEECDEEYEEMGLDPSDTHVNEDAFGLSRDHSGYQAQFETLLALQSQECQTALRALGQPTLFFHWSTS